MGSKIEAVSNGKQQGEGRHSEAGDARGVAVKDCICGGLDDVRQADSHSAYNSIAQSTNGAHYEPIHHIRKVWRALQIDRHLGCFLSGVFWGDVIQLKL